MLQLGGAFHQYENELAHYLAGFLNGYPKHLVYPPVELGNLKYRRVEHALAQHWPFIVLSYHHLTKSPRCDKQRP